MECLNQGSARTRNDQPEKELDRHRPKRCSPAMLQMCEEVDEASNQTAAKCRFPVPSPYQHVHRVSDEIPEDIYDPVRSVIVSTADQKVAAWFLDSDYDGRTFCITQAFFPDRSAWKKLSDALRESLSDPAVKDFEQKSGIVFEYVDADATRKQMDNEAQGLRPVMDTLGLIKKK